jgi:simple sugar transport system permease protein
LRSLVVPVLASLTALGLVLAGLGCAGYSPLHVLMQWVVGALGSRADIAASLQEACPLLLTGLAAGIAFRGGVLNIGAEGQFLLGALATVAVATRWAPPGPPWLVIGVGLAAGVLAGAAWAALAAGLDLLRGVPVVLSTILLNFVALHLVGVVLSGPLQAAGTASPQSDPVPLARQLPVLLSGTQLHIGVLVAGALALIGWLVQEHTAFGFELLVTGQNPLAARLAGMPVTRTRLLALVLSGGLAGLGGALQVLGVTHFLNEAPANYGYAGIAVALLGRLHPLGIAAAALFFGMLDTGARHVEKDYLLAVPHSVADVVKGMVVLAMLLGTAWRRQDKASGAGSAETEAPGEPKKEAPDAAV